MPAIRAKVLGVLLCLPLAARGQAPPACTAPTVETLAGPVCGKVSEVPAGTGTLSASAYLGLRYAQPPVRWQNPRPLSSSWTTPLQATEFGSICPQSTPKPIPGCPRPIPSQSEDCLFLNVWVPSGTAAGAKLPVMVFIHGGAFFEGSGSAPLFDGTYLAASGKVIVVTFNYRLGSLGFLALHGISTSTNNNFGFRDQLLALGWVKDNIAGFGGDPANVTIFGESAGAMSVGLHALVSPQSSGLFKAAMMESNPLGVPYKTLKDASKLGATFSDLVGCHGCIFGNRAKCLRGKTAEELVKAEASVWLSLGGLQNLMAWAPAIDGKLITGQPLAAAGKLPVPMVLGTNRDEGILFTPGKLTQVGYDLLLPAIVGKSHAAKVRRTAPYICSNDDCAAQMTQVATDYLFTCPNRYLAVHAAAAAGAKPIYVYDFTQVSNFNFWPAVPRCEGKVCHGDELPYVFHTPQGVCPADAFTPPEDTLSRTMASYWASFGARQDPNNGGGLFTWSPFAPDKAYLILNEQLETADDPLSKAANCELWDSIGYETAAKGKHTSR
ncbi:MAG: carboxylesterase family protein [Thermoanaerobaculia bacterium]